MGSASPSRRLSAGDTLIPLGAIALVVAVTWWWLLAQSAGMPVMAMPVGAADYILGAFAMWTVMMTAMMLPAATPMILLQSRFARQMGAGRATTLAMACSYLAVWAGFSALAALAQLLLVRSGLIDGMSLALGSRPVAAALLLLAALYQLSPLKRACLQQCRSPLSFIMRRSRPGVSGAIRLGLAHGAYCLGCCWSLMALLFAFGVMNLAWVGALTVLVLLERLAPARLAFDRITAGALAAGAVLLVALR